MSKEKPFDDERKSYALLREELRKACSLKRETPPTEEERQRAKKEVDRMCLSDNALFVTVMKSPILFSHVLSTIMGREMSVVSKIAEPRTELQISLYPHKSVRLDAVAMDESGKLYNIEMERTASRATPRRARYYASASDVSSMKEGRSFEELTDHYHIFITDGDALGYGDTVSVITRKSQHNLGFMDGSYILYVNMRCGSDDSLGMMLRGMRESEVDKIDDKIIRNALSCIRGDSDMQISIFDTKVVLDADREKAILKQGIEEGELREKRKTVIELFGLGLDLSIIAKGTRLTVEEVKAIIDEHEKAKAE